MAQCCITKPYIIPLNVLGVDCHGSRRNDNYIVILEMWFQRILKIFIIVKGKQIGGLFFRVILILQNSYICTHI